MPAKTATASETEWIRAVMRRYEQPLIRHAAGIVGDPDRARDVVQETFLRLCTVKRSAVEDRLAGWLFTVCRNRAFDVRKKEKRMGSLEPGQAEAIPHGDGSPQEHAARRQTYGRVLEAVRALPREQEEIFRLKFQDQLSYREIVQVTGRSLGTVSKLVTAALETIRTELGASPAEEVSR